MNIMRGAKLFFMLGILCSLLMSCEERPRIYTREDFIGRVLELATYLTDNYTEKKTEDFDVVGDSVLFKMETGDVKAFWVIRNYVEEIVFETAWNEGDVIDTIHEGFDLKTKLLARNSEQFMEICIHHGPSIRLLEDYWTDTYATLSSTKGEPLYDIFTDTYAPYEWQETKDTIYIVCGNMTCTLKKDVGIVKFTCDEHFWELVQ